MKEIIVPVILFCIPFFPAFAGTESYRISVSRFVGHPTQNAVIRGFQDYMKEKNISVEYSIHNALANMANLKRFFPFLKKRFG